MSVTQSRRLDHVQLRSILVDGSEDGGDSEGSNGGVEGVGLEVEGDTGDEILSEAKRVHRDESGAGREGREMGDGEEERSALG